MEIDNLNLQQVQKYMKNKICNKCGEPNHFAAKVMLISQN